MKERVTKETIKQQTEILRNSNKSMAVGIRRCLKEKCIDPKTIIVAEWFPDDTRSEFGIVVTVTGEVYQFGYDYLNKPEGDGTFNEWENITHSWSSEPLSKSIALALKENDRTT